MNCPFHLMIYKNSQRSYRDLPLRWAELGTVYRYEKSGVLHGLLRVRGFTQDDAHIICTPEQIDDEILEVLRFSLKIWKASGSPTSRRTSPPSRPTALVMMPPGEKATSVLKRAAEIEKLDVVMDEGGELLWSQDRLEDKGRPWPRMADDDIQFD